MEYGESLYIRYLLIRVRYDYIILGSSFYGYDFQPRPLDDIELMFQQGSDQTDPYLLLKVSNYLLLLIINEYMHAVD